MPSSFLNAGSLWRRASSALSLDTQAPPRGPEASAAKGYVDNASKVEQPVVTKPQPAAATAVQPRNRATSEAPNRPVPVPGDAPTRPVPMPSNGVHRATVAAGSRPLPTPTEAPSRPVPMPANRQRAQTEAPNGTAATAKPVPQPKPRPAAEKFKVRAKGKGSQLRRRRL